MLGKHHQFGPQLVACLLLPWKVIVHCARTATGKKWTVEMLGNTIKFDCSFFPAA